MSHAFDKKYERFLDKSWYDLANRVMEIEEERDAAVKDAEKYREHAQAMRLWIGSQAWKVDEYTASEAGLTLVTLFDSAIAAREGK